MSCVLSTWEKFAYSYIVFLSTSCSYYCSGFVYCSLLIRIMIPPFPFVSFFLFVILIFSFSLFFCEIVKLRKRSSFVSWPRSSCFLLFRVLCERSLQQCGAKARKQRMPRLAWRRKCRRLQENRSLGWRMKKSCSDQAVSSANKWWKSEQFLFTSRRQFECVLEMDEKLRQACSCCTKRQDRRAQVSTCSGIPKIPKIPDTTDIFSRWAATNI